MSELDELYKALLENEKTSPTMSFNDIVKVLKEYWGYLWSKKWIIIAVAVLGGIFGFIYAINKKITYTAFYSFTVGGSSNSSGGISNITALLGMGGGSMDAFSGDNVLELLKSKTLMQNTLLTPCVYNGDTITFMEYALICDSVRVMCEKGVVERKDDRVSICDVHYPVGQSRETFSREQDSILMEKTNAILEKNVSTFRRDKKLSYMEYGFSYGDEGFAKKFSAAHLAEATKFYENTKTKLTRENLESFQSQADSVRTQLDRALSRRAAYLDGNRNASGQFVSAHAQKLEMDVQILATTYAEMMKNIQVLKLDLARQTPLIQIIDSPVLPLANDKTRKLKSIAIAGFAGGFLSCLFFIAFYYVRQRLKGEECEDLVSMSEI